MASIIDMGTELLTQSLGSSVDADTMKSALSGLLGDGQGGIDLAGLASKMAQSGDLGSILNSWLGDGANDSISADKIMSLLGDANVADFASKLGTDSATAANSLSQAVPKMLDGGSSGGSLLDAVGGVGGLLGAAKSFLS